jgi:hypothetical protein
MSFEAFRKDPMVAATLSWAYGIVESAAASFQRDIALGFITTDGRRTAIPGDAEACVHEIGHGHGADRGHLEIEEADAESDGNTLARIVVYKPTERPSPECALEVRRDWCAFVRMRVEGPAAQARFCIEQRGQTATVEGVWRELCVVAGCEEDMLDAREITRALSTDAVKGRELLHTLAGEVVGLIATGGATWRTIQVGASLLAEYRRLRGRDVHWLMRRARARESYDEIRAELAARRGRRFRRQRQRRAMSPHLRWLTQGVATARRV